MKRDRSLILYSVLLLLGAFILIMGCRAHQEPTMPDPCLTGYCSPVPTSTITPFVTPTVTVTPTPVVGFVSMSGVVYADYAFTTPVPGLSVNVYQVDGSGARSGGPVASTATNASAAFSFSVAAGHYYEVELSDGTSAIHVYLPEVTAPRSDLKLMFTSAVGLSGSGYISSGGLLVVENMSGNIQPADTVSLDGGGNLNSSSAADGTYSIVEICAFVLGTMLGVISAPVSDAAAPGAAHTLSYKGTTMNVRVYLLSANNVSIAVFY